MALTRGEWLDDIFNQEIPTGAIDGVNNEFTLSKLPHSDTGVICFLNAVPQVLGTDFTVSQKTVTMTVPPQVGQRLYFWYVKGEL